MKTALLVLAFGSACAYGQMDPGVMAAQQAMQLGSLQAAQQMHQEIMNAGMAAQQAMQLTMQQMQIAQLQASLQNQGNFLNVPHQNPVPVVDNSRLPWFSIKSGMVKAGTKVHIKWRGPEYSAVYYSTDGWTPTTASTPYTGPITINATAHFQAIAVGWDLVRSAVVKADYRVNAPPVTPPAREPKQIIDGVLHAGTRLRLATGSEITSETAQVGDKAALMLDQDVKAGDIVLLARGTPVEAFLTCAAPAPEPQQATSS
jgi:hypothetical protein